MSTLEDDLARIAALRGRPVENYIAEAKRLDGRQRGVHSSQLVDLFRLDGDYRREMRAYDRLPPRSRLVLSEAPICPSASKYADLLARSGDEVFLIDALRDCLPGIVRNWALDHFGRDHPSARRLA